MCVYVCVLYFFLEESGFESGILNSLLKHLFVFPNLATVAAGQRDLYTDAESAVWPRSGITSLSFIYFVRHSAAVSQTRPRAIGLNHFPARRLI